MEKTSATKALEFAERIKWLYDQNYKDSAAINTEIVTFLGINLYKKFCEKITESKNNYTNYYERKYFKKEFLENPYNAEVVMKDCEVIKNYNFSTLIKTLSQVLETPV